MGEPGALDVDDAPAGAPEARIDPDDPHHWPAPFCSFIVIQGPETRTRESRTARLSDFPRPKATDPKPDPCTKRMSAMQKSRLRETDASHTIDRRPDEGADRARPRHFEETTMAYLETPRPLPLGAIATSPRRDFRARGTSVHRLAATPAPPHRRSASSPTPSSRTSGSCVATSPRSPTATARRPLTRGLRPAQHQRHPARSARSPGRTKPQPRRPPHPRACRARMPDRIGTPPGA